jgi:hypothetical protein
MTACEMAIHLGEWLLRVVCAKERRQSGPDRSVSNDLLTSPWVRPIAAYAGVATVSLAGFLQAQNGAAGQERASARSPDSGPSRYVTPQP